MHLVTFSRSRNFEANQLLVVSPRRVRDQMAFVRILRTCNERALAGVPHLLLPDNLKSGVHKASYDPEINRSYGMRAAR
jgi:hypothetical protein